MSCKEFLYCRLKYGGCHSNFLVHARDDKNLPIKDQLIISGTHLLGNNWNMGRFNELPSSNKLVTLKVLVRSDDLNEFLNLQIVVK